MGTASTMNSLAEALGMQLARIGGDPGALPRTRADGLRDRQADRRDGGEDLKPSDIMTRAAFENAIVTNSAIGGSTNAPIHLNAIARHLGVELDNDDWQTAGAQGAAAGEPAAGRRVSGRGLPPGRRRAGRDGELLKAAGAAAASGRADRQRTQHRRELRRRAAENPDVIRPITEPLMQDAGFLNLKGNLFDSAIMKTSVISRSSATATFRTPTTRDAFEGAPSCSTGPRISTARIDDPSLGIDEN
jgi:dihydroxy-acid dehydratase